MIEQIPEILNRKTVKSSRSKPPTVQLHIDGQLRFSGNAVELLGLEPGDKIELMIHGDDKGIIYFTKSEDGFELKKERTINGKIRLLLLCRPLVKKLFLHFGISSNTTYDISNEISRYYDKDCWFILRAKKHIPVKWRTNK